MASLNDHDYLELAFFDRFFPISDSPAIQPTANIDQPVEQFLGWYKSVRSSVTTLEKIATLITASRLIALDDDVLEFEGRRWVAVDHLLYRDIDGDELMAFIMDEQGTGLNSLRR